MKTKQLLAVMISVITIISFSSCEKDEDAEPKIEGIELSYGDTLEANAQAAIKWYAYELMVPINDTIWPPDQNGNPIIERDPVTGEWNIMGIQTTEVTVAEQLLNVTYKSAENLVQERGRTIQFFNENPNEKVYVSFPENSRIISRVTEDGKVFETEMEELNNLRQRLVDNPTHRMSQEIEIIHTAAQPTWLKACKEDFIDEVLNPSLKSKSSKSISIQIQDIDNEEFELVAMEILVDYAEKGIKPNQKQFKEMAKRISQK